MIQSKRIFVALLVVILLTFCTLTAFAAAEEAPSIDIAVSASSDTAIIDANGVVKAEKDAVVTFTVTAKENKVFVLAASLYVNFNPDHLELQDVQVSENGAHVVRPDRIAIDFDTAMSGELVSVSFKVKDIHEATKVTVVMTDIVDSDFEDIAINWTGAQTTVDVHSYGEEQVRDLIPDDCTAGKEIFRVCTSCPADKNEEIVVARPNEEGHDESGAAATCTTAQICAREGCVQVVDGGEALGHDDTGASRNCTTDQICARPGCGAVLMEKYGNHDESGAAATCTTAQVCAREGCDFEIVPALGHDGSGDAATCLTAKVCAREGCNVILAPKPDHNASGPDADCVNDKVCANEGCTVVLVPKLGHDVSGPAGDCVTDKICAREGCGAVLAEAPGHDESGKAATCTTDKVCARNNCNFVLEERFGHDESGAEATCQQAKVCVTCGEVLVAKLDAPEAHVYGEWVVETEATMSSTGLQSKVCTICENKVTEEIPEKSSAWLIILIIVGVLVLGGGGFAAYWFLIKNKKAKAESEETTEENSEEKTEEAPVEAEATAEATEEKTEE